MYSSVLVIICECVVVKYSVCLLYFLYWCFSYSNDTVEMFWSWMYSTCSTGVLYIPMLLGFCIY